MKVELRFKGVSPLIATVLLISFTVAVAGIIATWITQFASTTSQTVSKQSDTEITCAYGSVNIRSLKYSSPFLSGVVENNGQIDLGSISLSIIYQNATSEKIQLCKSGITGQSCATSNLSLRVSEQQSFNFTLNGSNYEEIRVITNCSNVVDTAKRVDVS